MPTFSTATFRTIGSAATTQNVFSIFNSGSNRVVRVRRLVMQMDATAVLTGVMPLIKTSIVGTAPGAGVTLSKVAWDSAATATHGDIVVKGECSTDGGTRTALTGTPGNVLWQQYGMRLHTAVGQVLGLDNNVLSAITETYPVVLRSGEGLIVHVLASAAGSNPATNHYFVQCAWDEDAS
jgi:hypothetical protein